MSWAQFGHSDLTIVLLCIFLRLLAPQISFSRNEEGEGRFRPLGQMHIFRVLNCSYRYPDLNDGTLRFDFQYPEGLKDAAGLFLS